MNTIYMYMYTVCNYVIHITLYRIVLYRIISADNGKEILCMSEVLQFLTLSSRPIIEGAELRSYVGVEESEWVEFVDELRGMIVTKPGKVCINYIKSKFHLN